MEFSGKLSEGETLSSMVVTSALVAVSEGLPAHEAGGCLFLSDSWDEDFAVCAKLHHVDLLSLQCF